MRNRWKFTSNYWPMRYVYLVLAKMIVVSVCGLASGCVGMPSPSSDEDDASTRVNVPTVAVAVVETRTTPTRSAQENEAPAIEPSAGIRDNSILNEVSSVFRYDIGTRPLIIPDPVVEHRSNGFLFQDVYSGLTRPSVVDDSIVEPDLAVSYDISLDGLTYTFKLREDVRFSDGTPLTSQDVKWSWERALRPETNSSRASLILGVIAGAADVARGDAQELEGFQIVDDATFTVALIRRNADFLWLLADPVASVLKESNVSRWPADLAWEPPDELPVGSGPFRFRVLNNIVGGVVLDPNPYYWDVVPSVDAVEYENTAFRRLTDFSRAWEQGLVDNQYLGDPWCNDSAIEEHVLVDGIQSQVASSDTAPRLAYLAFNTAVAPYDDANFRRALVASANTELPEFQNLEEPHHTASGLLPPGFPGHDESAQVAQRSRERAESALATSAYAESFRDLNLHMLPELLWPLRQDFERTTANWRDWLGLEVTFTDLPFARWEDEHSLQLERGTLQMRYMNLRPRYPSPHAILGAIPNLFGPNAQSAATEELQRMLDTASAEQDSVRRLALYQDIEDHIIDRAMVLPMFWNSGGSCYRVQDWVEQFSVPKWGGSVFRNVVIDTEHPAYPSRTVGN